MLLERHGLVLNITKEFYFFWIEGIKTLERAGDTSILLYLFLLSLEYN